MITVRVPATTANIGPGFDCLGIALSCYASIAFELIDNNKTKSDPTNRNEFNACMAEPFVSITGCDLEHANSSNLIYQALVTTLRQLGKPIPPISICIDSQIPISRGLGSSAACIVAGVLAANEMSEGSLSTQEMFQIATQIEGHPDNIAPAMFGGVCVSMMSGQSKTESITLPCTVHPSYRFIALVPDMTLSTEMARSVLPAQVPFSDAVHNIGRSVMVLKALESGDAVLLSKAVSDVLHEPYRMHLIPDYERIKEGLMNQGNSALCISGAGPTLLFITQQTTLTEIHQILQSLEQQLQCKWQAIPLTVDNIGATIERS